MEKSVLAKGEILTASDGHRWIIGKFIGARDDEESYEAASYDGKTPADYSAILQIVPCGINQPMSPDFQFHVDHATPYKLAKWKVSKQVRHLGIPSLLGSGYKTINNQNYKFIIIEYLGKDLLSFFLENDKEFEEHTVYKIVLQLMAALKYMHSNDSYIHGDIAASRIAVFQNCVYLMNICVASHLANDEVAKLDNIEHVTVALWSRDAHRGVSTMRGDMEMLFYNMVQWLGIELPWEKILENPSLVLEMKKDAFANVDKFLQSWFEKMDIPDPVCELMKLLATMNTHDVPVYSNFRSILVKGLRRLYHVPHGKLELSMNNEPFDQPIAEDFNQENAKRRTNKQVTVIPCLGNSMTRFANIIAANCRHESEVRLRDTGPDSLMNIICGVTCRKRNDIELSNQLADAWDEDTGGLKTITRRLWRVKALKPRKIRRKAALAENHHEESRRDTLATAAASVPEDTNGSNRRSNPGASNSQSRRGAMSRDGIPSQDHVESHDLPCIPPPSATVRQTARSPSPSRWSAAGNSPARPSTSDYGSRSSIQDDSRSEATSFSRASEPFDDTEHSRPAEVMVVKVKQESTRDEVQVTSESRGLESWQNKHDNLNAWLKLKEQNFAAFGSIPSEPRTMFDQVQQVRVLLDEFRLSLLLRRLKNAADPEHVPQFHRIQRRWWELLTRLESQGKQLADACRQKLRDALQDLSNNLDQLSLDNDQPEQQLSKIEVMSQQLEDLQRTLLANANAATEQMCRALGNQLYVSDLRLQLGLVKDLNCELQRKIASKKADVESCLRDGRRFDDSCKEMHVWLVKELERVQEKPRVSTDHATLQKQYDEYKVQHQRVLDRETAVMELLEMGRNLATPQGSTQQRFLESIKSQWDRLSKLSYEIFDKLASCVEKCDEFYQTRDPLLRWLSEAQRKFANFKRVSLEDIGQRLGELNALRDEVHAKSGEIERCKNLGRLFISHCDVDEDCVVYNELDLTKSRWTKLNRDLGYRLESFEDVNKRFADLDKSLLDLQRKIEPYEKESVSPDTSGVAAENVQFLHRIKELQTQTMSLREPLDVARQQAVNLVRQSDKQGIDASRLMERVNHLGTRIGNLKNKFDYICKDIHEREYARFEKEIQNNEPAENASRDSSTRESHRSRPHSERRQDRRDSESNGRGRRRDESSSRSRRSRSRDTVSNFNPSLPKKSRSSRDSSVRDSRSPRRDNARRDASQLRDSSSDRTRTASTSSSPKRHWPKPQLFRRPMSRQDHFSNRFQNSDRRDRSRSVSRCDSRFGRGFHGRSQRWNYQDQIRHLRENSVTTERNWESKVVDELNRQKEKE